jgi:hypothetical protein
VPIASGRRLASVCVYGDDTPVDSAVSAHAKPQVHAQAASVKAAATAIAQTSIASPVSRSTGIS